MAEIELLAGQRQPSESDKAVIACNDYLRLGVSRSLSALVRKGTKKNQKELSESTLKKWSAKFDWQSRTAAYDGSWEQVKNEIRTRELAEGLAQDFERVRKLKRLAEFLEDEIYKQDESEKFFNVWVHDVKSIGSGEFAERVDIERFNGALIGEFRAVLDDIAKEVGGRVKKQEIGGPDGRAIDVRVIRSDDAEN